MRSVNRIAYSRTPRPRWAPVAVRPSGLWLCLHAPGRHVAGPRPTAGNHCAPDDPKESCILQIMPAAESAPSGNRTRVRSMATTYSTATPMMPRNYPRGVKGLRLAILRCERFMSVAQHVDRFEIHIGRGQMIIMPAAKRASSGNRTGARRWQRRTLPLDQ